MPYVELACRLLTGLTFLSAGISKLRDREGFARATRMLLSSRVRNYRATANVVVAGEIGIACLVTIPVTVVVGYALALVLAAAFAIATGFALRRGVHEPCRCFGSRDEPLGAAHIVRDLVLMSVAFTGMAGVLSAGPPMRPAGVAIACGAGVIVAILLIFLDDVMGLFRSESRSWDSTAKEM